ncbi:hypothetical protein C5S29_04770 [ANME-1 cluster archaeon GoMg3.2]|nr:hypothetical protein [ANME-1 cluster archaeon GoMg3.2]
MGLLDAIENFFKAAGVTIDIDDLFVVERSAPRDESELFDEERERLKDLRVRRDDLQNPTGQLRSDIEAEMADKAADLGVDANMIHHVRMVIREKLRRLNRDDYWFLESHKWQTGSTIGKINQLKDLYSEIKKIGKEIHGILYNEPGVLPTTEAVPQLIINTDT